jgi:hypothetical protein
MAVPFGAKRASTAPDISAAQVNHLPIVAHFARRLGLAEIVNLLVPTQMEVEPGLIALGLVLDTLSGRSPLYHLETAFADCDRALLFAQDLPAQAFSDDAVGRTLDGFLRGGHAMENPRVRSFSEENPRVRSFSVRRFDLGSVHGETPRAKERGHGRRWRQALRSRREKWGQTLRYPHTSHNSSHSASRAARSLATQWSSGPMASARSTAAALQCSTVSRSGARNRQG